MTAETVATTMPPDATATRSALRRGLTPVHVLATHLTRSPRAQNWLPVGLCGAPVVGIYVTTAAPGSKTICAACRSMLARPSASRRPVDATSPRE